MKQHRNAGHHPDTAISKMREVCRAYGWIPAYLIALTGETDEFEYGVVGPEGVPLLGVVEMALQEALNNVRKRIAKQGGKDGISRIRSKRDRPTLTEEGLK